MSDFELTADVLQRLAKRNQFSPKAGRLIFFGIRGALPIEINGTGFASAQQLRFADVNHQYMRCTIGQFDTSNDRLAVFPGSTVPHIKNISKAARRGGLGANMLMLGHYAYSKGPHPRPPKRGSHRAFRQASWFPVWRSRDDHDYELDDMIDNEGAFVWDNLHSAYNDNIDRPRFASAGCQVVCGHGESPRGNGNERGPWRKFVSHAYGTRGNQPKFSYYLFSAAEVAMVTGRTDDRIWCSLRFGSSGDLVKQAQAKLIDDGFPLGTPDGDFGRNTLDSLIGFQERNFGRGTADGILGPNTASALDFDLPRLSEI